jgi:hypothetical protein
MVSLPVRASPTFAIALNETTPAPLPVGPLGTLSHPRLLLNAVQLQPAGAVTLVDPVPPVPGTNWLAGATDTLHAAAA